MIWWISEHLLNTNCWFVLIASLYFFSIFKNNLYDKSHYAWTSSLLTYYFILSNTLSLYSGTLYSILHFVILFPHYYLSWWLSYGKGWVAKYMIYYFLPKWNLVKCFIIRYNIIFPIANKEEIASIASIWWLDELLKKIAY